MRTDLDRLKDILRAIDNVEKYKDEGEERFQGDDLVQVWALHQLLIVGEAARGLSEKLRGENPRIPRPQVVAPRNVVVHEYFGLNPQHVWMVLVRDPPVLRAEIMVGLLRTSP
jgi:uncharacterized protein with HEPN domain